MFIVGMESTVYKDRSSVLSALMFDTQEKKPEGPGNKKNVYE